MATRNRLPMLNEQCTHGYQYHTPVLGETEDETRISEDRYCRQMAALIPQIRLMRLCPLPEPALKEA
jgi:hypothetical protein